MAGHNFSGYISGLWQALFAAFIHLFTRPFRTPPSDNNHPNTTTSSKSQPAPSASEEPESQSLASARPDPDLERGPQQDDQDDSNDDAAAMAAYKKRGGQKRPGVKAKGPAPSRDKENIGPSAQPNQLPAAAAPSGPNDTKTAPLGASSQGPVSTTGPKPSGGNAPGRPTPPAQQPAADTTKKDLTTPPPEISKIMVSTQAPDLTAVVPAETQPEIQRAVQNAGSSSQAGAQAMDPAAAAAAAGAALATPASDDKQLDKNSAAVEAAAVPAVLPVVSAVGGLTNPQLAALKPLAPLVTPPSQVLPGLIEPDTEEGKREREVHLKFMREALAMGEWALSINETPVGCVLVYKNRIIAKGMNATNVTRNGTRHAEFMALSALLSHQSDADVKDESTLDESCWGDVDPSDGHIFPYGQKLHPSPMVSRAIIEECVLYVTVEPCVMCASLLRQLGIKKVFFGAVNDKFGGTGGVFRIHVNSKPTPKPKDDRPYQNGYGPHDMEHVHRGKPALMPRDDDDGDGGNVERGYPAEGGYLRDEAVSLLRRFYVQENGRAPQPRKKEGRAARLYAMESAAANGGNLSDTDLVASAEASTQPPATEEPQKDAGPAAP